MKHGAESGNMKHCSITKRHAKISQPSEFVQRHRYSQTTSSQLSCSETLSSLHIGRSHGLRTNIIDQLILKRMGVKHNELSSNFACTAMLLQQNLSQFKGFDPPLRDKKCLHIQSMIVYWCIFTIPCWTLQLLISILRL